jgi:hypothetical protein
MESGGCRKNTCGISPELYVLLETFLFPVAVAAEDRFAFGGLEGNFTFFLAFGAYCFVHFPLA